MFGSVIRKLPRSLRSVVRAVAGRTIAAARDVLPEMKSTGQSPPVVRCGVIGLGVMGRMHAKVLSQHSFPSLAGLCSRDPTKRRAAEEFGCHWFDSPEQMIASGEVGAVVIATPHWQHPKIATAALRAGLHVVCEKPLAVTLAQAMELIRVAKESPGLLTVVFQNRFQPSYQFTKALLASGELGTVIRCEITETFWRPAAYYRSAPWRGTWKGEGGGVLVNQAPHVLDRYVWLCGLPESVVAFCDPTLHNIEVEDSASAVFRHGNRSHGFVHVSTAEAPSTSRMLISCDRGSIAVDNGIVRVTRLHDSIRTRTASGPADGAEIGGDTVEYAGPRLNQAKLLWHFYENFGLAVAGLEPLAVTAVAAAQSVELANAMLLSSASGRAIPLPLNPADFDAFIAERIGNVSSGTQGL